MLRFVRLLSFLLPAAVATQQFLHFPAPPAAPAAPALPAARATKTGSVQDLLDWLAGAGQGGGVRQQRGRTRRYRLEPTVDGEERGAGRQRVKDSKLVSREWSENEGAGREGGQRRSQVTGQPRRAGTRANIEPRYFYYNLPTYLRRSGKYQTSNNYCNT